MSQARTQPMPPPLRREVRLLTTMLGRAIEESGGPELLADVERLRTAAIRLREQPTEPHERRVLDAVRALDEDRAEAVARAFTCYFQLVNLAEEHQRVRALRERSRAGEPVADSIRAAAVALDPGRDLEISLALTAHPTEAKRRAVVENLWRIAELLETLDDPRAGTSEEAATHRRLSEEISALWATDPVRSHRPEPLDEVRGAMALFDQTIFRVLPLVYRELDASLSGDDAGSRPPAFRPFLSWSSWIGADRDGNPSVTAEVTAAAAEIHADHILRGLEAATRRIGHGLSASERDLPPSEALHDAMDADAGDLADRAKELQQKLPDAPHRRKMELAAERLARTRARLPGGYDGPENFVADLRLVQESLAQGGNQRLAFGELQHLLWQAETFGFHLASLEVRQHSDVHAEVLRELAPDAAGDAAALDRISAGPQAADRASEQARS